MSDEWMPEGKIDRIIYRLDNRHHDHPFPGSRLFCDLWDWRVIGNEYIPTLIRERLCAIFGRDPYPGR